MNSPNPSNGGSWDGAEDGALSFTTKERKLTFIRLTEEEVDSLCESGNVKTTSIAMFAMCVGIFVTVCVTLRTIAITDAVTHASFVGAAILTGLLSLWFGVQALLAWRRGKVRLRQLKGG